jgi:murein DD-endopeptidase MepM/ murein hydrolase activator NlpD
MSLGFSLSVKSSNFGVLGGPVAPKYPGNLDRLALLEPQNQSNFGNLSLKSSNKVDVTGPFAGSIKFNLDFYDLDLEKPEIKNLVNSFILPAGGTNWGQIHPINAVDIANLCGTPVVATARGVVSFATDKDSHNWNGGYGEFIQIEHLGNKISTRYGHLSEVFVQDGQSVLGGEIIGRMGNTGNVSGPSGCHLHFEVLGAPNPFIRKG